jgi:hypothetical protein
MASWTEATGLCWLPVLNRNGEEVGRSLKIEYLTFCSMGIYFSTLVPSFSGSCTLKVSCGSEVLSHRTLPTNFYTAWIEAMMFLTETGS